MEISCTFRQNQIHTRNIFSHFEAILQVHTYGVNNQSASFQPKGVSVWDKDIQQHNLPLALIGSPETWLWRAVIVVGLALDKKAGSVVEAFAAVDRFVAVLVG